MLSSIKIVDNTDCQLDYISRLPAFANGTEYTFKPGVNIIIGPNGCGKSSLMNIIYDFTFTHLSMESKLPVDIMDYPAVFKDNSEDVHRGIEIHADYKGKVFRLMSAGDMKNYDVLSNVSNFSLFVNATNNSTGEKIRTNLYSLFHCMFDGDGGRLFPLRELVKLSKGVNNFWANRLNNLIEYYKANHIKISGDDYEYTVLMDEPDRNLDINNIKEVHTILSFHKPEIQVIAVIHNPALIYKLSKLEGEDKVNFVEMTPGYLNKVIKFMEKD